MRYRFEQTFEFSNKEAKYIFAFMVHTMAEYAKIPINAEDAIPVCGPKKAPPKPADGKCPFIVKNQEVYYRTFHDKTFGAVHGAVVEIEDALRIVPDMVSKHENYLNKSKRVSVFVFVFKCKMSFSISDIGIVEACRLHLKMVFTPITSSMFDQVVIEGKDNLFLSSDSVMNRFEMSVQFISEKLGSNKKIVDR